MILPRYITAIRSASAEHLVELGGDDDDGGAVVALGDDPLVDELDRADVEAARRLGHDQQLQRAGQLAGEDDLLLVAAGQASTRGARCDGVRTSNSSTRSLGVLRGCGRGRGTCRLDERRAVVEVEHEVLGDREARRPGRRAAGPRARSRRPSPSMRVDAGPRDVVPVERDRRRTRRARARRAPRSARSGRCPGRRRWRRSRRARTAKLTPSTTTWPVGSTTRRSLDREDLVARLARRPCRPSSSTGRPTISEASSADGRGRAGLADDLAAADHRDPVGDRAHLAQLVGDEDDRGARAPCSERMISIRSSVSCGVSTAVGSSRISTLASRISALMISTRCWTPTGRSCDERVDRHLEPVALGDLAHLARAPRAG